MQRVLKNKKLANNGITLIALVITIIILLILAGIAISALTGENGLWTQAKTSKKESVKAQADEEVKLAVSNLVIDAIQKDMTQEEKRTQLENELKNIESSSTVSIKGIGFLASHRGYEFKIDSNYNVSEAFNAEEWDKTACKESSFIWESDNPEDGEAYHTIIGYADGMQNEVKLKIPSRCHKIRCDGAYLNTQGRTFARALEILELPDTVTEIGEDAFSKSNLTSVTIPESVTNIGSHAFYECTSLVSVTIPESVTNIEDRAFLHCTSLTSVTIPDSITNIGYMAFCNCTSLTSVTIPDSITNIGDMAFYNCTSLTSVTIPDSVTSIEDSTFYNVPHIYYNGTATGAPWGALAIN